MENYANLCDRVGFNDMITPLQLVYVGWENPVRVKAVLSLFTQYNADWGLSPSFFQYKEKGYKNNCLDNNNRPKVFW